MSIPWQTPLTNRAAGRGRRRDERVDQRAVEVLAAEGGRNSIEVSRLPDQRELAALGDQPAGQRDVVGRSEVARVEQRDAAGAQRRQGDH